MPAASRAMAFEPAVTVDFSNLEFELLPTMLAAIIARGGEDKDSITEYLVSRNCRFDKKAIGFVLDHFEGNNLNTYLWSIDKTGSYALTKKTHI